MTFKNFINECKKKDVLKLISIYIVSTWVMLQVLSVTWQPLGLPEKSVTILIIILLAGFPIYLFYIWKFRLHISDEIMEQYGEKKASNKKAFKTIYFTVLLAISLLSVLAITVILKVNFIGSSPAPPDFADASEKIAVLKFGNNTGKDSFDVVGKMAADWIVHGINEKGVAQVISPETLSTYLEMNPESSKMSEKVALTKFLNPSKIISGNFFLDKGSLLLQGSIQSSAFEQTLITFKPQKCDSEKPLECVENLKQLVISYLFLEDKNQRLRLQSYPPKFNAYQDVIEAKASYEDPERYIALLERAITEDSTYFEPKVLRVAYYYGEGSYVKADSLFNEIRPSSYNNKRQLNLLNHYEALLGGQNGTIYSTIKNEYEIAPFDLQTNSSTMVVALQYVNRPQDVQGFYDAVDMSTLDIENCTFCLTRMYVKTLADIQLGNYERAIAEASRFYKKNDLFITPWLVALIRSGQADIAEAYFKDLPLDDKENQYLFQDVAHEFKRLGNVEMVKKLTKRILFEKSTEPLILADFLFLNEDYRELALMSSQMEFNNDSLDPSIVAKIATAFEKLGETEKAAEWLTKLKAQRAPYRFGKVDYALAQYYASQGDTTKTFQHLLKSVKDGALFKARTFENDPIFYPYKDDPKFIKISHYWYDK